VTNPGEARPYLSVGAPAPRPAPESQDWGDCRHCEGRGRVPLITSWSCTRCGNEIDPSIAWVRDGDHRVRHVDGSPLCRGMPGR